MKHTIRHGLDDATAKRVLEKAAESYCKSLADYSPRFAWTGEGKAEVSFKALGMTAAGQFSLSPGAIDVEMEVPFILKPFRSKAVDVIEAEVKKWVAKAQSGEL